MTYFWEDEVSFGCGDFAKFWRY